MAKRKSDDVTSSFPNCLVGEAGETIVSSTWGKVVTDALFPFLEQDIKDAEYVVLQPEFNDTFNRIVVQYFVGSRRSNFQFHFSSRDEFREYGMKIVSVIAGSAKSIRKLELMHFGDDPVFNLSHYLQEFGKAGHWKKGLESLILWYWDLGRAKSLPCPLDLETVPSSIQSIDYNGFNVCNVQECGRNLATLLNTFPSVGVAEISIPYSPVRNLNGNSFDLLKQELNSVASSGRIQKIMIDVHCSGAKPI